LRGINALSFRDQTLASLHGIVPLLVFSTANFHHEPEAELKALGYQDCSLSNPACTPSVWLLVIPPRLHRSWISHGSSALGSCKQVHVGSMLKIARHVEMSHAIS
jgi:hypothetical protein